MMIAHFHFFDLCDTHTHTPVQKGETRMRCDRSDITEKDVIISSNVWWTATTMTNWLQAAKKDKQIDRSVVQRNSERTDLSHLYIILAGLDIVSR